jgi:hypothetical protein
MSFDGKGVHDMTLKDLCHMTEDELDELERQMASIGNLKALGAISLVREWYGKTVLVFKGRKVPIGTTGVVFWIGQYDNSKYGDPWGIYTTTKLGIRDHLGNVFFTADTNCELCEEA